MHCRNSLLSVRSAGLPTGRLAASVGRQMQRRGSASDPRRSPASSAPHPRPAVNLRPLPCAADTADLNTSGFRSWFDRGDHADVLLRTCTSSSSGKASSGRLYKTHAIVLAVKSGKFKTMLNSPRDHKPKADNIPRKLTAPNRPPIQKPKEDGLISFAHELTLPMQPEEVDAMDLLLRLIYDHDPPPVTSDTVPLLFQCLKLTDKYEVQGCKSTLLEHLSAAAGDLSVLSRVCSSLPEVFSDPTYHTLFIACHSAAHKVLAQASRDRRWCTHQSTQAPDLQLVEASRRFVIAAYSDVPTVIRDDQRRERFCSLPFAAVLAWAESDDLRVQSENCVAYLLSAWVKAAQGEGGQRVNCCNSKQLFQQQLEQLAEQVRVLHLGPAYQHHILPQLEWFKGCSCNRWLPALLAYRCYKLPADEPSDPTSPPAGIDKFWDGPEQWLARPRKQSDITDADQVLRWEVDLWELRQLRCGKNMRSPATLYIGGFHVRLCLTADRSGAKPLYRFTPSSEVGGGIAWSAWAYPAAVVCGPIELKVSKCSNNAEAVITHCHVVKHCMHIEQAAGTHWGGEFRDMLGEAAPTMSELLDPMETYQRDGKLHVEARFTLFDWP